MVLAANMPPEDGRVALDGSIGRQFSDRDRVE